MIVHEFRRLMCSNHDRDVNAARNILAAGLELSTLGGNVRPGVAQA
jgi:transposase